MQVSLEQPGGLERRLRVEVPERQIAEQVRARLQNVARNARIDGFRPGKAPAKVIERQFGARVRDEVIAEVVRSSFAEAIGNHQLRPVADPVIEPGTPGEEGGFAYVASFEVFPDVQLTPMETLQVERPECEITEADVDRMVEVLRGQARTWREVTRAAADGDQVVIDFAGTLEGETTPFENGSATDFPLVLGQNRMIEGFETGLLGVSAGDSRTLALRFPAQYHKETLAGRGVNFAVTVKRVEEAVLPALDADFFRNFGVEDGQLSTFRAEVRENMERERDRALERRFNAHVLDQLNAQNALEVPRSLVRSECARLQQEMMRTLATRGIDPAQVGAVGDLARFEDTATRRVKLGLIMAEIIRQSGVTAEPGKVRARIEAMAASYEQPEAMVRWYYEDPRRLQEVEGQCLEDEAVKWVAQRASTKRVSLAFDDLMNPRQTAVESANGDE